MEMRGDRKPFFSHFIDDSPLEDCTPYLLTHTHYSDRVVLWTGGCQWREF